MCLNGHVDVVGPGSAPWRHGPWSGAIEDGCVHGRGSVDMKGGVVAALHALARAARARRAAPEVVLQAVALRGGRRARHVRRARARRRLRRLPDPRADRLRGRLRAGRRADLPRRPCAAAPHTPRCGSRAARRSTATSRVHLALQAHERARERRRRAPADARARAAVSAPASACRGRRVVEQRARPARVRGPARRAASGASWARRGRRSRRRAARRRRGAAGRARVDGRPVRAGRHAGRPPVGPARPRARSRRARRPRAARRRARTAPTCASSRRAASRR